MIDEPRAGEPPTYPNVATPYRVAVATIAALLVVGVPLLNLPIWVGALLTGAVMMAVISALQAALRWRWRTSKQLESPGSLDQ